MPSVKADQPCGPRRPSPTACTRFLSRDRTLKIEPKARPRRLNSRSLPKRSWREASAKAVNAIAYATKCHSEWFWRGAKHIRKCRGRPHELQHWHKEPS